MKLCPKCQKHFSDDANFCPTDAARLVPMEGGAVSTDSLSSRFELGDTKLGGTRTGAVIRAKDKQGGAAVAVKLVSPAVIGLPGVAQRLERELKQIERVQSAGVAKVLASGKRGRGAEGRDQDETWVAMEWLEGAQTLAEAIGSRGPIPLEQAANLIEVIGEALIEAAQVGVVHRDLAPKNVLFAGNEIKLINFSLPVPTSPNVPGVPEFVAPEQVEGKPVDQRSNLYSLGALYYYVLTGLAPEAGNIKPPSQIAQVPAPVETAILRALDRSPTKRFLTVRQFVDEVSRIARGEIATAGNTQPMGKIGKPKAELMQTLLGVRGINGAPASPPGLTPIASAPTVGAGVPAIAPGSPISNERPQMATVHGMASGALGPIPGATPTPATSPAAGNVSERSPWAPPANSEPAAMSKPVTPVEPPMPVPTPAAPVAPVVPAAPAGPVLAAPVVAAGKKKPAGADAGKGKFRETMWFKKGDLDAQAAVAAAEEHQRTGKEVATDKADSLPIDERYKDDGSITHGDKDKYSLRTGATMMMASVKEPGPGQSMTGGKVSEGDLIGEMKGGRSWVIALIIVAVLGVGFLLFMVAR